MIFVETELKGAFVIEIERREDNRGFFARAFCQKEFEAHGLKPVIAQANLASNRLKGTIRGMHFQYPPAAETKLVRCTRGAILDIIVDLRPESALHRSLGPTRIFLFCFFLLRDVAFSGSEALPVRISPVWTSSAM